MKTLYIKVQDEDSHWYWIPPQLESKFDAYNEDWENDWWIDWEIFRTWWWPDMVPDYWSNNVFPS